MAAALEAEGYSGAFDSIHGSSAGACGGAYFAAGQAALGTTIYYEEINNRKFIDVTRWIRGRPIMDSDFLIDDVLRRRKRLDVERIVGAPGFMHVVLTDIDNLKAQTISAFFDDDDFFLALKASICLPIIAGNHVKLRDRRYFDGGVSQHFAVESAIAAGATHVIVLMTRPADELLRPVGRKRLSFSSLAIGLAYGRRTSSFFDHRNARINEIVEKIQSGCAGPGVRIRSIARRSGATHLGRLATDEVALRSAAREGHEAVLDALTSDSGRMKLAL
jgi:predicted patatin/cPLA2 family phospholipase